MKTSTRALASIGALGVLGMAVAATAAARSEARSDTAGAMAAAAEAYVAMLDDEQRARGTWELDDEARFDWHFVPREREGMPLHAMSGEQRAAAHRLLSSVLSGQGYLKATGVMQLEGILGVIEGRPERRNPEDYYVSIFGTPSESEPWAWRYEGHHLALNFTSVPGENPSVTPAFMGSNPHVVPEGPNSGWRLLGSEEDRARELLSLLDEEQLAQAIIATEAPSDIVTGNARRVELDRYEGLPAADMTEEQTEALLRLMIEYALNANFEIASQEMERAMDDGLENVYFAWAGGTERGEGHYYRIHGPTILIEYDNVQGGANHVHSVWRDPENDFGDDLLRRHYEEAEHHQVDRGR